MGVQGGILHPLRIDKAFVVPTEHRPKNPSNPGPNLSIPVIDLSPLHSSPPDEAATQKVIEQVGLACQQWGFFQVINHGLPTHLYEKAKEQAIAFFELPLEEKRNVARTANNAMGYCDTKLTKNVRDWKEVFDITVRGKMELPAAFEDGNSDTEVHLNQWPERLPSLRDACEEYAAAAENLAFKLLELISQSLGLPPNRFHGYFKEDTSRLRLNHYRVCPEPNLALGVGPHKDSGALTVLAQDEAGGLEVKRKDGKWIRVQPDPAALTINVGGLFQVWSNDKFESVEHRAVVDDKRERLSIPFFLNPAHHVNVSPLPDLLDAHHPALYRPLNWGKFYKRRRDSNFKNLGVENLQIHHYAINREQ